MKLKLHTYKFLWLLMCMAYLPAGGQTLSPTTVAFTFNTQSLFMSGTNATQMLSYFHVSGITDVVVTVKAAGNLTAGGAASIPVNDFQIQTTTVSEASADTGPNNLIALSTTDQTLSSGISSALLATLGFNFKYTATGGAGFFVPASATPYSTTLTFTITGKIVLSLLPISTTVTGTLSVSIPANITTLTLQPADNTATLALSSAANYQNGAQLAQAAALNVFSTQPYHITISATQNLKNGTTSIPISNVSVVAQPSPANGAITTTPLLLSLSAQTLISSSAGTLLQNFDLTYATPAGSSAFLNKPAGTYTSTLMYTVTAP